MSDINCLPSGAFLQGGKYRITRFIGSGGFGCTYEAEHVMLEKRVAVKEFFVKDFCNRDGNTSYVTVGTQGKKEFVNRLKQKFVDEAKAICRLHHSGIVSVSDVFEENGTAYYVMDFIEGHSLQEMVNARKSLPERQALKYVRQVADALKYVHSNNRLQLDIKPGNIMIDGSDQAVLIDFGASKQYDEENGENSSTVKGMTPGYAPPEQMDGNVKKFMPATDIYSLGATLYKLLTGITPLTANERISGEELAPLPLLVSMPVRRAIASSMQLNKMKRPQSIDEFLKILDGVRPAGSGTGTGTGQSCPSSVSSSSDDSTVLDVKAVGSGTFRTYNSSRASGSHPGDVKNGEVTGNSGNGWGGNGGDVRGRDDKGVGEGRPSSRPNPSRAKVWLITACVIVGLVAGYFLLRSFVSGDTGSGDSMTVPADSSLVPVSVPGETSAGTSSQDALPADASSRETVSADPSSRQAVSAGTSSWQTVSAGTEVPESVYPVKKSEVKPVQSTENPATEQPFVMEEVDASFQGGGLDAFVDWVGERIVMPEYARENNIQGTVLVKFTVTAEGNVADVRVLEGVERSLDNEAVRVVSSSPKWSPARQNGRNVKISYKIPVTFRLIGGTSGTDTGGAAGVAAKSTTGFINGHQWVDLGLSVKWATCNVGASSPSDYGSYYAWGETRTKSEYTKDNCSTYGINIGDISGDSRYDAARANWGGTWRLPTEAEMQELIDKCTWTWTSQGGHNGYRVAGPNGKSIFLPAAGYRLGSSLFSAADRGTYWCSYPKGNTEGGGFQFDTSDKSSLGLRFFGNTVRPVSD